MNKKVKKFISKGLMTSILLVNIPINSLAGTLSDDTRYETFEGSDIAINNILEEGAIDVEIEGNTLINLVDKMPNNIHPYFTINENYITILDSDIDHRQNYYTLSSGQLNLMKTSTTYTIIAEITKNTLQSEFALINNYQATNGDITSDGVKVPVGFTGKFVGKFTTLSDFTNRNRLGFSAGLNNRGEITLKNNFIILEGDWTNKEIPSEYFKGIKSVGEQEDGKSKIVVKSQTKNLISVNMFEKGNVEYGGAKNFYEEMKKTDYLNRLRLKDLIKVNPGEVYTVKVFDSNLNVGFQYFDENKKGIEIEPSRSGTQMTYTVPENAFYLNVYVATVDDQNVTNQQMDNFKCTLVKDNVPLNIYNEPHSDDVSILLKNPLRGLPSGIKDRIIKKNGQWVIKRNCGEVVYDGSSDEIWYSSSLNNDVSNNILFYIHKTDLKLENTLNDNKTLISNTLKSLTPGQTNATVQNIEGISGNLNYREFRLNIPKSKLSQANLNGLRQWLQSNPITIVYQLDTPYYEQLRTSVNLNIYKETTYISNNSNVPANMKITIDRVANRAQEAIEAAKVAPTTENLSIARMWINLMRDSILKDEFQEDVNNIIQIEDLEIERKKVSANLDLYVRSANMLSMSLSTNSVTFENYSGVEDMEFLNAVGITVKSSLPYDLNAYVEDEISNKDKTNTIDVRTLNIRESSKTEYKQFNAVAEKLILKENCEAANDIVHNIDLKLSNDDTHKTDVYKTVIKFEIEQK